MKYPYTTKQWKSIKKDVEETLKDKSWKPTIYTSKKDKYISEVDFFKKSSTGGIGNSYLCCECSQPLLKRMAAMIPKKYIKWC